MRIAELLHESLARLRAEPISFHYALTANPAVTAIYSVRVDPDSEANYAAAMLLAEVIRQRDIDALIGALGLAEERGL